MSKKIVYTAIDEGVDGREPPRVIYAFFTEADRDEAVDKDKAKLWRRKGEQIVDTDLAVVQALSKLNGIDRLVLGLSTWPSKAAK